MKKCFNKQAKMRSVKFGIIYCLATIVFLQICRIKLFGDQWTGFGQDLYIMLFLIIVEDGMIMRSKDILKLKVVFAFGMFLFATGIASLVMSQYVVVNVLFITIIALVMILKAAKPAKNELEL